MFKFSSCHIPSSGGKVMFSYCLCVGLSVYLSVCLSVCFIRGKIHFYHSSLGDSSAYTISKWWTKVTKNMEIWTIGLWTVGLLDHLTIKYWLFNSDGWLYPTDSCAISSTAFLLIIFHRPHAKLLSKWIYWLARYNFELLFCYLVDNVYLVSKLTLDRRCECFIHSDYTRD